MSNKGLICLMLLMTLVVYTPILWVCVKTHRSVVFFILMLLGNLGVIYHLASTMQQVANNADPQAGMGAALYLIVSIGTFAALLLSAILIFFFEEVTKLLGYGFSLKLLTIAYLIALGLSELQIGIFAF